MLLKRCIQQHHHHRFTIINNHHHLRQYSVKPTTPITKISSTEFHVLMANDVYEIVSDHQEIGGLAQLSTIIKQERDSIERKHGNNSSHCIVTLNGDFLSASQLAFRYQGYHMIDILNAMPMQYVVPGNHEFDFGSTVLEKRIRESKFTWICSNVFYRNSDKLLNGVVPKMVLTVPCDVGEKDTVRVGVFGVCTPATKSLSQPGDEIEFRDPFETAFNIVHELRQQDNCDVVIGLTHLAISDDKKMASLVRGIDILLGGHDHFVTTCIQNGVFIHKAGLNGQYLANIKLIIEKTSVLGFGKEIKTVKVFPEWKMVMNRGYKPDPVVKRIVDFYQSKLPQDYNDIIGLIETKLESYTDSVRSKETTMGNLVADVLKEAFDADLAIINGGTIRGDRCYDPGYEITKGDIYKEFPFPSGVSLQCIQGKYLIEALEQGLQRAEKGLGAFPHLSRGAELRYGILERPMNRIKLFELDGKSIDPERIYNVCATNYMLNGGDGYTALKHNARIVPHKNNDRTISELVVECIERKGIVSVQKEGRIKSV
jgi:5'-nucleotidase/UDP-sugar diphosphatase